MWEGVLFFFRNPTNETKQKLLDTYGLHTDPVENNSAYPLINWRGVNGAQRFDLLAHPEQLPPRFSIQPEPIYLADMLPDLTMLERMIAAANAGAQACLICNLVDVAQVCYQRLKELNNTQVDIDLFHARFTLNDRREKENRVISNFGKMGSEMLDGYLSQPRSWNNHSTLILIG